MPKVSVIIPVYNTEKYLRECIDSVLNQTFDDFEVLLINDGSSDKSGQICEEYVHRDKRVKVFHKENGGVSSARNLGLDNAIGEWITFVDSDDWISTNYFDLLKNSDSIDLILLNMNRFLNKKKIVLLDFNNIEYNLKDFVENYNLYPHYAGPCGKFYKNIIISKNNIRFNENLSRSEDAIFNLNYIFKCGKIRLTNKAFYNYRNTTNSLSKKNISYEDAEFIYNHIFSLLNEYSSDPNFISRNNSYPTERYFMTVLNSNLKNNDKKNILKTLIKRHKAQLIKSTKKQRIHLIPLNLLIRLELVSLMIFLVTRPFTSKNH